MIQFFKKEEKKPKELKEILKELEKLEGEIGCLSEKIKKMEEENAFSIQKVGIVRFNPFQEVGGDQSFSLAFLNAKNDGVVITSFYTREGNRVYGKPIKAGVSQYTLSQEEKKAIARACVLENSKS